MKFLKSLLFSSLLAVVAGTGISMATGADQLLSCASVFVVKAIHYIVFKNQMPDMALFAGVNKEIWLEIILEKFYRAASFLKNVDDWSAWVEFNTLNFADAGGDPTVLINNTTYPIPTNQRTDTAKTIALDTYDTENTRVRNVEEIEAAYAKLASVIKGHKAALIQKTHDKAIHAYAPAGHTAGTPVLATTGAADRTLTGLTGSFKRMTIDDVANLEEQFDNANYPKEGRVLVLNPSHKRDLMAEDKGLFKAFANHKVGDVFPLYGFEIETYANNPLFVEAALTKEAFGAAKTAATSTISSVAFLNSEVMKADGTMEMFHKPKSENVEQRADEVGFQKRGIYLPKRDLGIGAIVSAK